MKTILKIFPFALFLIIPFSLFAQYNYDGKELSPEIQSIIKKLAKDSTVYSSYIGIVGQESPTQKSLIELSKQDTSVLIKITNYFNPVIRCFAFRSLIEKGYKNFFPIIINHLQDTANVRLHYADVVMYQKAGDFFIDNAIVNYTNAVDYAMKNKVYMDSLQKCILDSIVIFTDNELEYLDQILYHNSFNENYYERINKLAVNNSYANVALAKYKREGDAKIIYDNFENIVIYNINNFSKSCLFEAISIFPDEIFWHKIKGYLLSSKKLDRSDKNFCKALFKYQNEEALQLIDSLVKVNEKEDYILHTFLAVLLYGLENSHNENLLQYKFYVAENYNVTTPEIFSEMTKLDSIRTNNFARVFFSRYEEFYYNFSNYNWIAKYGTDRKLVKEIFLYLYAMEPDSTIILAERLLINNYNRLFFDDYLDGIRYIDDVRIKQILVNMLGQKRETNDEYYFIINAIVSYKDKSLVKLAEKNLKSNACLNKKNKYTIQNLLDYLWECERKIQKKEMGNVKNYFSID